MPWDEVMHKWKKSALHSGSKKGPIVKNQKQAIAIMLSEKRQANAGKKEYQSKSKVNTGPSKKFMARFNASKNKK